MRGYDFMTAPPITVGPGTGIAEASRLPIRVALLCEVVTEITGREIVSGRFPHTPPQRRAATS